MRLSRMSAMERTACLALAAGALFSPRMLASDAGASPEREAAHMSAGSDTVGQGAAFRVVRLVEQKAVHRRYPYALPTLLAEARDRTTMRVDEQPILISSFEDPVIFKHPFIFVNFADREDWTLSPLEQKNLRAYLDRGGFLFIDAGINAAFLRDNTSLGQHHSFAEWDACPEIRQAFKSVYQDKSFRKVPRSHEIFKSFYRGLPDPGILPQSVRQFVVEEKWPDGTYAAVALHVNERIAVLTTPIVSMGWGKDALGNWATNIAFRIREGAKGLSERLETAAYSGARYETTREDGRRDIIYCQKRATPAWVQEPDGRWRVFRYYHSREISDYAHVFFTRFGINILVYAMLQ